MMAECQLKTNPFVSMTTRCNAMMTSESIARRESCYDGHSDDDDDNVMNAGCSATESKTNNEQWVRLSKNLLLQLVERICMLSFQQVESQSSSVPQLYRTDEIKHLFNEQKDDKPHSPAAVVDELPDSEPLEASPSTPEVHVESHVIGDDLGNQRTTTENCSSIRDASSKVTCLSSSSRKRRPLRMAAQNVKSGNDVISGPKDHPVTRANDDEGSEKTAAKENTHSPAGVTLITGIVASKSCSFARRRHRLNAANSLRRHRQRSRRRSQLNRRHVVGTHAHVVEQSVNESDPHRGSMKRQKQSWLALNKSLVLCALERALSADESSSASMTSSNSTTRIAKSIWNPATSLTHHETPMLKSPEVVQQRPPPYCNVFPMGLWRGTDVMSPLWVPSANVPVAYHQTGDVNRGLAASCTNSSLLCSLLGFETGTAGDVMSPALQSESRPSGSHVADKTIPSFGMTSPASPARIFSFNHSLSPSENRPLQMASSPNAIVSGGDVIAPLDYRTVKHQEAPSNGRVGTLKPGRFGDKWVVLDKGDVSTLVESLVNTMIASGAPSERRREQRIHSSNASTNEPRKWKTNLMQRLRTETQ